MNNEYIEKKKLKLFNILSEVEMEIGILSKNISKAQVDLANVQTIIQAEEFDKNHDLEEGLKHIRLF